MAEYIEKAELIKKLCFETAEWYYSPTIKTIKEFPAADVQPVDSWIAVTEKLPEIDKYVLIYYPYWTDNEIQVARLCYDKLTFDICGEFNAGVNKVTHWRPLPEPPKDGELND